MMLLQKSLRKAPWKLLPVIVWIYGGAYISGSASFAQYPPDYFIEKDTVYVSINYRTGPLGNHPQYRYSDFNETIIWTSDLWCQFIDDCQVSCPSIIPMHLEMPVWKIWCMASGGCKRTLRNSVGIPEKSRSWVKVLEPPQLVTWCCQVLHQVQKIYYLTFLRSSRSTYFAKIVSF